MLSRRIALAVVFTATPAVAQQAAAPAPAVPAEEHPESAWTDRLSLNLSLRIESDYFFRGIAQRTDSWNFQPAGALTFDTLSTSEWSVSLVAGFWNNFSDDTADNASSNFAEHWYEADLYAGATISYQRLSLTGLYTWYLSPSSDFQNYEDLTLTLAFDDAGLWDDDALFATYPFVSLAIETNNAALGPDSGVWLGVGVTPTIAMGDSPLGDFSLLFPVSVGLGLDDYYQRADGSSSTFGYADAGVIVRFNLADRAGAAAPTLDLGVRYHFLDGVTEDVNDGRDGEAIFSVQLGWSF